MTDVYTTGTWTPRSGEEDAFVAAWTEFRERMGRAQRHVEGFVAAELEVVARISSGAAV